MTLPIRLTTVALVAASFASSGCLEAPRHRPSVPTIGRPSEPILPDGRRESTTESRLTRKRVSAKREVSTLVADDGSTCTVSDKRYRDTKVGDDAWCVWVDGDA